MILGCKKIYISGVDLPMYRKDHYAGIFDNKTSKTNKIIRKYINDGISDYKKIQMKNNKPINLFKIFLYKRFNKLYQNLVDLKNSKLVFKNFKLTSSFYQERKNILFNFNKISNVAESKNIEIYNTSKYSMLNKIKNIKKFYK